MSDNNVQEDFEVTKQAMLAYEVKLKREIVMVTKEDLEKARVAYEAADAVAVAAATYAAAAYATYEAAELLGADAEAAAADADDAAYDVAAKAAAAEDEAWDKYVQLKREYENGIKSTED